MGRWSQHPLYSHPIFAVPLFILAFLVATKFVEEDNALDVRIVESILEGIKVEKKQGLNSTYFQDLANNYEGWKVWIFAFIRISPPLMIMFSLFNSGPLSLLINYLTQFFASAILPYIIVHSSAAIILVITALFLGKITCRPYQWLLWKLQANYQT